MEVVNPPSPESIKYTPAFAAKGFQTKELPTLLPPPGLLPPPPGLLHPSELSDDKSTSVAEEDDKPTSDMEENSVDDQDLVDDAQGEEMENIIQLAEKKLLEMDAGTVPRGSQGHALGECKPCAYFWSQADSCRRGSDCDFCHLCDQSAVKKYRKLKKRRLQAELTRARHEAARARRGRASQKGAAPWTSLHTQKGGANKIGMATGADRAHLWSTQREQLFGYRPQQAIFVHAWPQWW